MKVGGGGDLSEIREFDMVLLFLKHTPTQDKGAAYSGRGGGRGGGRGEKGSCRKLQGRKAKRG